MAASAQPALPPFLHPFAKPTRPSFTVIQRGQGALVWDADENEYVDAMASLWYCAVGHGRTEIADAVGEPPIAHLTTYRLALAADLLCAPGSNLASVARHVGYRSPYALSAAFTRQRGTTPSAHRAANASPSG